MFKIESFKSNVREQNLWIIKRFACFMFQLRKDHETLTIKHIKTHVVTRQSNTMKLNGPSLFFCVLTHLALYMDYQRKPPCRLEPKSSWDCKEKIKALVFKGDLGEEALDLLLGGVLPAAPRAHIPLENMSVTLALPARCQVIVLGVWF